MLAGSGIDLVAAQSLFPSGRKRAPRRVRLGAGVPARAKLVINVPDVC
jgi:hypothetical protein